MRSHQNKKLTKRTKQARDHLNRWNEFHDRECYDSVNEEYSGWRAVDLTNLNMPKKNFSGACLQNADFSDSNLSSANFNAYEAEEVDRRLHINRTVQLLQQKNLMSELFEKEKKKNKDNDYVKLHEKVVQRIKQAIAEVNENKLISDIEINKILEKYQPTILSYAKFKNANLYEAQFNRALLVEADFSHAILDKVKMNFVQAQRANFREAKMNHADLSRSNLEKANFAHAKLLKANLKGAELSGANFKGADLRHANLIGARMNHVNLEGVNFQGAEFFPEGDELTASNLTKYLDRYEGYYFKQFGFTKVDKNLHMLREHMLKDLITKIKRKYDTSGYFAANELLTAAMQHNFFILHHKGARPGKGKSSSSQNELAKTKNELLKMLEERANNDAPHHQAYVEWALIANINKLDQNKLDNALREIHKTLPLETLISLNTTWHALYGNIGDYLKSDEFKDNLKKADKDHNYGKRYINLQGANLQGQDLSFVDLSHVDLRHANLKGANLNMCKLIPQPELGGDLTKVLDEFQAFYANSSNKEILKKALAAEIMMRIQQTPATIQHKENIYKSVVNHPLFASHRNSGSRIMNSMLSLFKRGKTNAIKTGSQKDFAAHLRVLKFTSK